MAKKTIYWTLASPPGSADHVTVKTPLKLFISGTWQKPKRGKCFDPIDAANAQKRWPSCGFTWSVARLALALMIIMAGPRVLRAQGTFLTSYAADTLSYAYALAATADGGYLIAGHGASTTIAGADLALMKFDAMGGMQWSKRWSTVSSSDRPLVVGLSGSGALVLSMTHPQRDLLLMRTDDAGDTLWTRVLDHPSPVAAANAVELPGGDVVVASYTLSRYYLTRIDTLGAVVWSQSYTGGSQNPASAHGARAEIRLTSTGDLIACGMLSHDLLLESSAFIMKVDQNGGLVWCKFLGGDDQDGFRNVIETADGGFLATGYHCDSLNAPRQMMAMRFDSNGSFLWMKRYPTADESLCRFLVACPDGNYAVGGYAWVGGNRGLLFKMTDQGDVLWSHAYGPSMNFWDAVQVNNGLVLASTRGNGLSLRAALMAQDTVGQSNCPMTPYPLTPGNFFLPFNTTVSLGAGLSMTTASVTASPLPLTATVECGSTDVTPMPTVAPSLAHPNPTTGPVRIAGISGSSLFSVLDPMGRSIIRGRSAPSGIIDLSSVPAGVYVLAVDDGTTQRIARVVVER